MVWLFYVLWVAGIALKFGTAIRMLHNGLSQRLPLVTLYLFFCATSSAVLLLLGPGTASYRLAFSIRLPFAVLMEGAAILAVFWVVTENYPNFRTFGSVLLGVLAAGGVTAAFATRLVNLPVGTLRDGLLLLHQSSSVLMVIVLAGTRLALPRSRGIQIPVVAQRAADVLLCDVALLGLATAYIARLWGFQHPVLANMLPQFFAVAVGVLWFLAMRPVAEAPVRRRSVEELRLAERRSVSAMHLAASRVRETARRLDRQ